MNKKSNAKGLLSHAGKAVLCLGIVFLSVYMFTILSGSAAFFTESAIKSAKGYFEEDAKRASELAEVHYSNLYEIAEKLQYSTSAKDVESIVGDYIGSEEFGDLRYYSHGQAYSPDGAPIVEEASAHELLSALAQSTERGCSGVYYDKPTTRDCIAFFVPVRGSQFVDGILSIVPARNIVHLSTAMNEKACSVALIDESGKCLSGITSVDMPITVGNDYYKFIYNLTSDNAEVDKVGECIAKGTKSACSISFGGTEYTVVSAPVAEFDNHLYLVTLSVNDGLIGPEMTFIRHIVNLLCIAIIALMCGFVFAILYHKRTKEALSNANLLDSRIECANVESFKIRARELMASGRTRYAVTIFEINNFSYIDSHLGYESTTDLLKFVSKVFDTFTTDGETYGYAGNGMFAVLMKYAGERAMRDKIRLLEGVVNKNEIVVSAGIKVKLGVGIYQASEGRKRTIQEMLDGARSACEYIGDINQPYAFFTEKISEEIAHNERIEAQMERALESGEFRLFLQPKYSVAHDRIDSAEALVRWFDTERGEYLFPAEFINLFETNGFIVKLDHYIYLEVLEYMSAAAERGDKIVPVSVNVSRVTASSEDFISFYVGNKKKYRIGDDFITLEFTESFAMEDYDKISEIVNALHENGMRCSIDDFGSGYSSFSILKQIPMDELKLDRMFIKKGEYEERDEMLISTVINLAKSMGMKVVQEGVETKEDFDRLVSLGCDIIQGYYYAKAISLEEYKIFINTNTSIKYKSLVK